MVIKYRTIILDCIIILIDCRWIEIYLKLRKLSLTLDNYRCKIKQIYLFTAMKRISREEDSKREENSPAERFSEIIFLEPALKAADEKSCRKPALWAYKRIIL